MPRLTSFLFHIDSPSSRILEPHFSRNCHLLVMSTAIRNLQLVSDFARSAGAQNPKLVVMQVVMQARHQFA